MAPDPCASAEPRVLASYEDLTLEQRNCADDIVEAFLNAERDMCTKPFGAVRQELWRQAFSPSPDTGWDTSKPPPGPDLPAAPTHKDLAIKVGIFNQALPPSSCAIRQNKARAKAKAKSKLKKTKESENAPTVTQYRQAGSLAFLRARLDARTRDIEWFWSDAKGKGADSRFVNLKKDKWTGEPTDVESAQADALSHHDQAMASYARICHREYAAYWARCRLLRHVGATPNGQRPANPTGLDYASLQEAQLLWPVALASPSTSEALKAKRQSLG